MKIKHLAVVVIFPLLLTLVTIFCWPTIRIALVDWTLKDYGKQTVGVEFLYDKITFDERGDFLLHNLVMTKEGMGTVKAKRGYLHVKFDLQNRLLVTHISLDPCTLTLAKEWALPSASPHAYFFEPSFTLEGKGTLLYPEGGEERVVFTLSSRDEIEGKVVLEGAEVTFSSDSLAIRCSEYQIKTPLQIEPYLTITSGVCSGSCGEGNCTNLQGVFHNQPFSIERVAIAPHSVSWEGGSFLGCDHLSGVLRGDFFGDWDCSLKGTLFTAPFEGSFARKGGVLVVGSGLQILSPDLYGGVVVEEGELARYTLEGKGATLAALFPTLPFSLQHKTFGFEGTINRTQTEGVFTLLEGKEKETLFFQLTPESGKIFSEEISLSLPPVSGKTTVEGFFNRDELKLALLNGSLQFSEKGWSFCTGKGSRILLEHKWGGPDWHWTGHLLNGTLSFYTLPLFAEAIEAKLEGDQSGVTILEWQTVDGKAYLREMTPIPFGGSYTLPIALSDLTVGPIKHFTGHLILSPIHSFLEGSGSIALGETDWPFILDHLSQQGDEAISFDAWAGMKDEDLLRLAGSATPQTEGISVQFHPNQTHFGTFYPQSFTALLGWEGNIKNCLLTTSGSFQSLASLYPTLSEWRVGHAQLKIEKENEKGWTFKIEHGEVGNALVSLEGNWSCPILSVDFCGIKEENSLTIGMEGEYNLDTRKGKARVHHFEAKLETLAPYLHLAHMDPRGVVRATEGVLEGTESKYDLSLCASLEDFSLFGYPFQDTENIHLLFSSDRLLTLSDIRSILSRDEDAIGIDLKHLRLDIEKDELEIKGLEFSLLKTQKIPLPALQTLLHAIEPEEGLAGTLNYSQTPYKNELDIHFAKGIYKVGEIPLPFDTLSLHKSKDKISIEGITKFLGRVGCFHTSWLEKSFPSGTLALTFPPSQDELELDWSVFPTLTAENLRGTFYGHKIQEGMVLSPTFCAHLRFDNRHAILEQVIWKKWSGEFNCPVASLSLGGELSIPKVYAHGIVPPHIGAWSQLVDPSFSIEYGEIVDFHCSLDAPAQAEGIGEFTFTSKPKLSPKNLSLFREKYPPRSSFKPCAGEVTFKMGQGKMEFVSFHDVLDPFKFIRFSPGSSFFDLETLAAHLLISLEPNQPKVRLGDKQAIAVEGSLAEPMVHYK